MTESVTHVEGLGKPYRAGERERYFALRDVITRAFTAHFRRSRRKPKDFLRALRDVSLDAKQGKVLPLAPQMLLCLGLRSRTLVYLYCLARRRSSAARSAASRPTPGASGGREI